MSKYKPLADFLGGHVPDEWKARFDDLEHTLGSALPKTAREKAAWWANQAGAAKPHAKAWLDSGWLVHAVDIGAGEVTFRRGAPLIEVEPDPTAHKVMAAADAAFEKGKTLEAAKKVGIAAAVFGVVAGVGLLVKNLVAKRT